MTRTELERANTIIYWEAKYVELLESFGNSDHVSVKIGSGSYEIEKSLNTAVKDLIEARLNDIRAELRFLGIEGEDDDDNT